MAIFFRTIHLCNANALCRTMILHYILSVDGGWSDWGPWGACKPPCGIGLKCFSFFSIQLFVLLDTNDFFFRNNILFNTLKF